MPRKVKFKYVSVGGQHKIAKGYVYKGVVFQDKRDIPKYKMMLKRQEEHYKKSGAGRLLRYGAAGVEAAIAVGGATAGQPASLLLLVPAAQMVVPEKYQRKVAREAKYVRKRLKELV
jgi:hypothetical protein